MKPKIAVIYFPGSNCEEETMRACQAVGMDAEIIRWNTKTDLEKYDGFILPGGWSYEDRIRAGIIAARDPLMIKIKEQAAKGKVVLGICNGCQILIETGIIPGLKDKVQMALAPNKNQFVSGYFCTWSYLKNNGKNKTAFNSLYEDGEIIHIPIAHGEGRFITDDQSLIKELQKNNQIIFQYCDKNGNIIDKFPINPNGSLLNIAGISNKEGNVLAMMPHPERATWNRQLEYFEGHDYKSCESLAQCANIFKAIKQYIENKK